MTLSESLARALRRALFTFALLAICVPLLGAESEPVRLRFVFGAMNEAERAALIDGARRFEASRQDVVVEPVPYQWSGYGFHDALVRMLALQDPSVDVYRIDLPWVPELAAPGWLLPLDSWVPATERDGFVEVTLRGGTYRDQLYALPLSLKGNLLFYRRDLLEAHGLEPPTSLAQLGAQAALLRQAEGLEAGLALHPLYLYNDLLPALWASGGDVLDAHGEVVLDSPVNRAVLAQLAAMVGDGPQAAVPLQRFEGAWSEGYAALFDDFVAGKVPFAVTWSPRWFALRGTAVEGRVGVAPVPGLEPGSGSSNLGTYYVAVSRFSRHPEQAADFVRFMAGPEAQRARLEMLGEVPALHALLADPQLVAAYPQVEAMAPVLSRGGTRPRVPDERALGAILEEAFHSVLVRGHPPERALASAAGRIELELGAIPRVVPSPGTTATAPIPPSAWMRPLAVGLGLVVALLAGVGALLLVRQRFGLELLVTLQAKLMLAGAVVVVVLAASSTGVATSLAHRAQQREIEQHRSFFAERVREHALALGKSTGLSISLLDEQVAGLSPTEQRSILAQLLMVSQFTEDLVFVELLDDEGELLLSDRDSLFLSGTEPAPRPPLPGPLDELVASRAVHVYDGTTGGDDTHTEVVVPLFRNGVHRGALRLGLSRARFDASLQQTEARHAATLRELTWAIALTSLGLLLLCLAGVAVFSRKLSRPVVALTAAAERVRGGELELEIRPASRDELGTLAEAMAEMVQGLRDRDFIRDAFGRYLTRELAERLVEDPGALKLGGHERTVTIVMSDLRGFSGLSERLGPEAMVALLNRYLAAMTTVILHHRGMINEFIGDAILVLFGALESEPDDSDRAMRCALDMQRALRRFNEESVARGLPVLAMGIGVNTGVVVAGNIGSEQRVKYGVVGPPVNHAARLESLTVGSQVYASADSLYSSNDAFRTRGPIEARVKGSEAPLMYFELLGLRGQPELDMVFVDQPVVEVALPARLARLEGKRVPAEREAGTTVEVSVDRVLLRTGAGLAPGDNLVLELELPDRGWTRSLWAKVLEVDAAAGTALLAVTSAEPDDLDALRGLAS